MTIQELGRKGGDGSRVRGNHLPVTASSSASVTLTAEQSGGVFLLDRATVEYFLPATPVPGMTYRFMSTIAGTGSSQRVTASATSGAIFLLGSIEYAVDTAATGECHLANGTSHVAVALVSAETGSLIGSSFEVTCLTATIWNITGTCNASGTMTTPFTT